MEEIEDVLKVFVYGRHTLSYRWIKPVVRNSNDETKEAMA